MAPAFHLDEPDPPRQDFSRFRCLWNPVIAADRAKSRPYATLLVTLDRATKILPADITGYSDPYAVLSINGSKENLKSSVQHQTLSPQWNESFQLDVFHPLSVLSIKFFDKDLVKSDDFLGWVDISIGSLHHNETVKGWFDLGHPDDYEHHYRRDDHEHHYRSDAKEPKKTRAGHVHLQLKLEFAKELDAFFAMMLPPTDYRSIVKRHSGEIKLNVKGLFATALQLARRVFSWVDRVNWSLAALSPFLGGPWQLFLLGLLLVWYPWSMLPTLITIAGVFVLLCLVSDRQRDKLKQAEALKVASAASDVSEPMSLPLPPGSFRRSLMEPMLNRSNIMTRSRSEVEATIVVVDEHDKVEARMKAFKELGDTIAKFSSILTADMMEELKHIQEVIVMLLDLFIYLDCLVGQDWLKYALSIVIAGFVTGLVVCSYDQLIVLQVLSSIVLVMNLFNSTVIGRFVRGSLLYSKWKKQPLNHSVFSHVARVPPDDTDTHRRSFLNDGTTGSLQEHHRVERIESGRKHGFVITSFSQFTWCEECRGLLVGLYEQGLKCSVCKKIVCDACAFLLLDQVCFEGPSSDEEEEEAPRHLALPTEWASPHDLLGRYCLSPCRAPARGVDLDEYIDQGSSGHLALEDS